MVLSLKITPILLRCEFGVEFEVFEEVAFWSVAGELHDGLGRHSLEEFEGAERAAAGVWRHLFEFVFGDFNGLASDFSVELDLVFHAYFLTNFSNGFIEACELASFVVR